MWLKCDHGCGVSDPTLNHCTPGWNITVGKIELLGPVVQKLTMSLVNDSLKFTSSDTQIF